MICGQGFPLEPRCGTIIVFTNGNEFNDLFEYIAASLSRERGFEFEQAYLQLLPSPSIGYPYHQTESLPFHLPVCFQLERVQSSDGRWTNQISCRAQAPSQDSARVLPVQRRDQKCLW